MQQAKFSEVGQEKCGKGSSKKSGSAICTNQPDSLQLLLDLFDQVLTLPGVRILHKIVISAKVGSRVNDVTSSAVTTD